MKVLIDGEVVTCNNDVKVIFEDELYEKPTELHLIVTYEGIILDRYASSSKSKMKVIEATMSVDIEYLDGMCI